VTEAQELLDLWEENEKSMGEMAAYHVACEMLDIDLDDGWDILAASGDRSDVDRDLDWYSKDGNLNVVKYKDGLIIFYGERCGAGLNKEEFNSLVNWVNSRDTEENDDDTLRQLVDRQAEDEGLWFVAQTAPEAYLQQALRELHALIENDRKE